MATKLNEKKCVPCQGGVPPLGNLEVQNFLKQIDQWKINSKGRLEKAYQFKNFKDAFYFVQKVADLAESQGHHPDIFLSWGHVSLEVWTHKINGLSESDFIFSAKVDQIS